jgi:hypothetical protein
LRVNLVGGLDAERMFATDAKEQHCPLAIGRKADELT